MATAIRKENPADQSAIYSVTEIAFRDMPYADGTEQDIVNRLRSVGALHLSLVAELDDQVIGHVAFSPARADDGSKPWFALGPVSVLPQHQRQGIGSALINAGLTELDREGALGCILVGNPDYYRRFGFEVSSANAPDDETAPYFMIKRFADSVPSGVFRFHEAFYGEV